MNELEVCVGCWAVLFSTACRSRSKVPFYQGHREKKKHSWGCQNQRGMVCFAGACQWTSRVWGQQPYLTKHSFLAYQNQLGSSLGVVKAEIPETLCGREFKVRALKKVFGGAWISHLVTYSLVLTVDGCSLQRAWLGYLLVAGWAPELRSGEAAGPALPARLPSSLPPSLPPPACSILGEERNVPVWDAPSWPRGST